jgi:uncharacterized protein YecA (UPF0149 family)
MLPFVDSTFIRTCCGIQWLPSEMHVKRGVQIVHGEKELVEKLGRNDPCPCGSGKRFKKCCLNAGRF